MTDARVDAFYKSALFLIDRMKNDGWRWRSNYLREHAACAYGVTFSNSESPALLDALLRAHPELKPYIIRGKRK
jgi:hypothetical protein